MWRLHSKVWLYRQKLRLLDYNTTVYFSRCVTLGNYLISCILCVLVSKRRTAIQHKLVMAIKQAHLCRDKVQGLGNHYMPCLLAADSPSPLAMQETHPQTSLRSEMSVALGYLLATMNVLHTLLSHINLFRKLAFILLKCCIFTWLVWE